MEMKNTGVAWIGDIPSDWTLGKVKFGFDRKKEKSMDPDPTVLSLARAGVRVRDISTNEGQLAASYEGYNPVEPNDLLLNPMDLISGANCSISHVSGVISPAYMNLRARAGFEPRYYDYYFKTQYWCMALFAHGKGVSFDNRWTLNESTLRDYYIPVPSYAEQQAIASYLDDRCGKIDEIIAEATASIEEYKELKQAVIDEYSMFGINKDTVMKETDYSWFPYMPSHWKLVRANRLFKEDVRPVQDGDVSLSLSQVDGLIPTDDMSERSLKSATHDNWKHVIPDDLVLNRFKGHLGVFFASNYEGMVSFHYGVYHAIRVGVFSKYYEYLFHSTTYKNIFALLSNGITVGLQNLSNGNFYSVKLLLPPIEEQIDIVKHLDERKSQIDALISEKQALIDDLQAYKKSLIYEVVTGKRRVV